jgi:hypothetical protein
MDIPEAAAAVELSHAERWSPMDGPPGAFQELEKFVRAHCECGSLIGDAGPPGADGYLLWIKCSCGIRFER